MSDRGMSQRELAAQIGVTEAAMSRYLKGEREPHLVTANRIAQELGVTLQWLVGGVRVSEVPTGEVLVDLVARNGKLLSKEQKVEIVRVLMGVSE